MATVGAVHLAGESLLFYLKQSYPKVLSDQFKVEFKQFMTGDLPDKPPATVTLSLILYRISHNEHLRQVRPSAYSNRRPPLALDLHYLLTMWGKTPQDEQTVFTWALLKLYERPLMDRSMLRGEAGWTQSDQIEWVPEDLPQDQMVRIWDKLNSPYRLSAAYRARVLQIEPFSDTAEFLPVVAREDTYRGPLEESER